MLYYLASPYGHPDESIKMDRFVKACQMTGALLLAGYKVLSPIAHSVPVADLIPKQSHGFWLNFDLEIISKCDGIIIYQLPGWKESKGMRIEAKYALATRFVYDAWTSKRVTFDSPRSFSVMPPRAFSVMKVSDELPISEMQPQELADSYNLNINGNEP